jgi:hypothetical protein
LLGTKGYVVVVVVEALFKLFPPIIAPLGRLKYDE